MDVYYAFVSCAESRQASEWTSWFRSNVTRDGFVEQRFQSVCWASVDDASHLRSRVREKTRYCSPTNCSSSNRNDDVDRSEGMTSSCVAIDTHARAHLTRSHDVTRCECSCDVSSDVGSGDESVTFPLTSNCPTLTSEPGPTPSIYRPPSPTCLRAVARARYFNGYCSCRKTAGNLLMCRKCSP